VRSNDGKVQQHDGTRKGDRSDQSAPKFPVEVFLLQDSSPALVIPCRPAMPAGLDTSLVWTKARYGRNRPRQASLKCIQ
jgi:hypothetical protein